MMELLTTLIAWLDAHGSVVQAIATVVLVGVTSWYAWRTSAQVRETRRASHANLLERLDVEYASEDMSTAMRHVRQWRESKGAAFAKEFERLLSAGDNEADRLDDSRRQISQYFQRVRVFCQLRLLEEKQVAEMHGPESFDFFLDYVDPLNEVVRHVRQMTPRPAVSQFFRDFRTRHFGSRETGAA